MCQVRSACHCAGYGACQQESFSKRLEDCSPSHRIAIHEQPMQQGYPNAVTMVPLTLLPALHLTRHFVVLATLVAALVG